ncbi:MAG: hypothetical protein DSY87_01340, partial [Methylococcus sp.]
MSNNGCPPSNVPDEITITLAAGSRQTPKDELQTMPAALHHRGVGKGLIDDSTKHQYRGHISWTAMALRRPPRQLGQHILTLSGCLHLLFNQ